ncbi:MAG: outer membrane beta-barrel protein [Rickettsiales bacterium]|jgi:opacity protein-like surface antigen|nr:outer membrane beta-barrel protein [Rickettsiales bacterium]
MRIFLVALATIMLPAVVRATDISVKPYISEKISYTRVGIRDSKLTLGDPSYVDPGTNEHDWVLGSKTAIGIIFPDMNSGSMRLEFEFGINDDVKTISQNTTSTQGAMAIKMQLKTYYINTYYDIKTSTDFTPYVGFGVGIANISGRSIAVDMPSNYAIYGKLNTNSFTYNIGFGVGYNVNNIFTVDVGYRYTNVNKMEDGLVYKEPTNISTVTEEGHVSSHEIMVGARYNF